MWSEQKLDEMLTRPSAALVADMKKLDGDIMILGAGGKMGPTLAVLAQNAIAQAGTNARVIAVSRFSDPIAVKLLHDAGVETISADLMNAGQVAALPDVENIIYMAGRKFGTNGQEHMTWAMNACVPTIVASRFVKSRIVVFSSGNVYPMVPAYTGGCTEETRPMPNGEYGMSCLARERIFEHFAKEQGARVAIYRLNFAVDLRYGVLYDICSYIMNDLPVPLDMGCFHCIWQGDANEIAIRSLLHANGDVYTLNVTGPQTVPIKETAIKLAKLLGKEITFSGEPKETAFLSNAGKMFAAFGYPTISVDTLIEWQAEWILSGGRALNKPTHFEERGGTY